MSFQVIQADCKRAVASLANMTNDELDQIMNDDEKIENILLSLEQSYLKEVEEEKENLLSGNNALAEANLSREPELMENREKLQTLSEEAEELSKKVEEKVSQLKEKTGDMSLETALALLQTAASEMEEESDAFAKTFLNKETEIDDFLPEFMTKRKLMHMRLVKAEKLSKILSRDPNLSNIPNYINAPPVSINTGYFPGIPTTSPSSVPYPTGPIGMPMPGMPNFFQNHY